MSELEAILGVKCLCYWILFRKLVVSTVNPQFWQKLTWKLTRNMITAVSLEITAQQKKRQNIIFLLKTRAKTKQLKGLGNHTVAGAEICFGVVYRVSVL